MKVRIIVEPADTLAYSRSVKKKGLVFKHDGGPIPKQGEKLTLRLDDVEYDFTVTTVTWVCNKGGFRTVEIRATLGGGK